MSDGLRLKDHPDIDDFQKFLDDAEFEAVTDWELNFVQDLIDDYKKYGQEMFFSEKQKEALTEITQR